MEPIDPARLTPEYLASLSEAQQYGLLEELKREVAKAQASVQQQQHEAVKRLKRLIAEHEAQLSFVAGELRDLEEILSNGDTDEGLPARYSARKTLEIGCRFYRSGKKMLALHMHDFRKDLAAVSGELTAPFEIADPFATFEYRKACAESDLAALQLLLIEYHRSYRVLCHALGVSTTPDAKMDPRMDAPMGVLPQRASKVIREELQETKGFPSRYGHSSLGLDETLPESTESGGRAENEPDPSADKAAENFQLGADAAAQNSHPSADGGTSLDEGEAADVAYLQGILPDDAQLVQELRALVDRLQSAVALEAQGLEVMAQLGTAPPPQAAELVERHLWNKINGAVYSLRRIPDQAEESPILTRLFPQTLKPTLPFDQRSSEHATRPIVSGPTDKLRLED